MSRRAMALAGALFGVACAVGMALRALVEELTALGWQQTGVGSAPWDLRFQRSARVVQRRG